MDGKSCGSCVSKTFLRCAATQKLSRRSINNGYDEIPVDILPVSHICHSDPSPQSVEPVSNTTLAPKELENLLLKQEVKRRTEKDR